MSHPQDARVPRADAPETRLRLPLAIAMIGLMAAMLAWRALGGADAGGTLNQMLRAGAWLALLAIAALAIPRLGLREAYLGCMSAAVTLAAFFLADTPWRAIVAGLDQAAFLAAFILLLTLLFETALTSPAVRQCGEHLARQPGGRRHAGLFWGTNVMAVLFNLGIVTLLSPLVRAGLPAGPPAVRADVERRQVSALLRGFAWGVIWSPTALAPLALFELIGGIDRQRWTLLGLMLAGLVFGLSLAEDALRARAHPEWEPHEPVPPTPWSAYGRFALATAALFALTGVGMALTGQGLVPALMLACPVMMAGWLIAQKGAGFMMERGGTILLSRLPEAGPVAVTLAASGYLGSVAAALLPMEVVADLIAAVGLPQWAWLTLLPLAIAALSMLAVSPIMFAVFFGSLFGALPVLPTDPTLLALSLSCGWALAMTTSPFATVVLLLSRQNDVPGVRLTLGWNGAFTAAAAVVLAGFFYGVTGGA